MKDWLAPGFPRRILMRDELVVDADPLIVEAAAFLDTMPIGERVSAAELATGIDVDEARASAILAQLEALGHTSMVGADGESAIFDPDGLTIPPDANRG